MLLSNDIGALSAKICLFQVMAVSSSLETCGFINSISSPLANVVTPETFEVDAKNDGP